MKLLREYDSIYDANSASERLEKKGILTHVSSVQSSSLSRRSTGAVKNGLWVVLNNQYQDAKNLIEGKKCEVSNPLSQKQIRDFKKHAKLMAPNIFIGFLSKIIAGVFAVLVLVALIFKIISSNV